VQRHAGTLTAAGPVPTDGKRGIPPLFPPRRPGGPRPRRAARVAFGIPNPRRGKQLASRRAWGDRGIGRGRQGCAVRGWGGAAGARAGRRARCEKRHWKGEGSQKGSMLDGRSGSGLGKGGGGAEAYRGCGLFAFHTAFSRNCTRPRRARALRRAPERFQSDVLRPKRPPRDRPRLSSISSDSPPAPAAAAPSAGGCPPPSRQNPPRKYLEAIHGFAPGTA
jgi:hypothetical protein